MKNFNLWSLGLFFIATSLFAKSVPNTFSADENNTIAIFKQASPNVVYVHRISRFRNNFSEPLEVDSGSGSGILWDKHGHIVTNYHVVHGADKLLISAGNQSLPVKIIGAEPRKDIAVLQLESPNKLAALTHFTPFQTVKTDTLVVGQKTLAIGNPFGLDHTLTTGIISALGREVPGIGGVNIKHMIQTDASINPGNSGGPLLDNKGRLIGLNTMIYSSSGSSSGVGFAVPSETLSRIVPQLIQYGRVKIAGIGIVPLDTHITRYFKHQKGVFIADVLPNTPAEKAGLKGTQHDVFGRLFLGDAIVAINQHHISNYNDLYNTLAEIPIGQSITLHINRLGKEKIVKLNTIDLAEEL